MGLWEDYPTISLLVKSYVQMEKVATILHIIEELLAWKAFVKLFYKSNKVVFGHIEAQQFKFFVQDDK